LNTCCIGPSGEDDTNSGPCTATIESADRLCPHSIYNCSTSQAREQRIRSLKEIIDEYLVGYRLRYRAPRFANYALGHVSRLLGTRLAVDIDANSVLTYQEDRLREGAAAKSINEEVRFLLKMLWAIQLPRTIGRMETGGGATDAT